MPLSMVIRERAGIRNSFYPLSFPPCTSVHLGLYPSVYLSRPFRAFGSPHLDLHGSRIGLKITHPDTSDFAGLRMRANQKFACSQI